MLPKLLVTVAGCAVAVSHVEAVEIIAHRGYSKVAPENTVSSFRLGWESKADACELDLYLSRDGHIAVIHDADTKRVSGIAKKVKEATLAELQALDVGAWKDPKFQGERIPSLAEALATMPAGVGRFFLEIKDDSRVVPVLARELEAWKSRAAQLCIIAFERKVAQDAKQALPWLSVYRLSADITKDKQPVDLAQLIRETRMDGLDGLDLGKKWAWSAGLVEQVRAAGLRLYVWTVNTPEEIRRFAELGVDGITTDDPVLAREILGK